MIAHIPSCCPTPSPDAQLVARFRGGDEEAFVELMSRHRARVYASARRILGTHADAEEIAQDVFVRAYLGLHTLRDEASVSTWLYRITMNLSRNRYWYYRRRRRENTLSLDGEDETGRPHTTPPVDHGPTPCEATMASDLHAQLKCCFARLEAGHREILILRSVRNFSYDEIAHKLRINVGTVKSRISRARENLRALLFQACPELLAR